MLPRRPEDVWRQKPPDDTIHPPAFPDRPDLFDEVEWGPFVTPDEARLAYRLWSLPDSILSEDANMHAGEHPYPRPDTAIEANSRDMEWLGQNVYEHLLRTHGRPKTEEDWDEHAQMRLAEDGRTWRGWSYEEIFGIEEDDDDGQQDDGGQQNDGGGEDEEDDSDIVLIEGYNVLTARYWTVFRLQEELEKRGLDKTGKSADLRRRLYDYELRARREERQQQQQQQVADEAAEADEDKGSLLPRTDLSPWGIQRGKNDYMLKVARHKRFTPLDMYTWAISLSPYNPTYWVSRAYLFYQMGYLDLALGDAHRAQLLCEVLANPHDRNRQPGLYARIWHAIEQHLLLIPPTHGKRSPAVPRLREPNGVNYFIPILRKILHNIISLSLKALQCWSDYEHMEEYLTQRLQMPYRDKTAFQKRREETKDFVHFARTAQASDGLLFFYERQAGSISGRPYPYSARDVDRTSEPFLEKLNRELVGDSQLPWKRCEVRRKDGTTDELAVYATVDIRPGKIIYADEPSIRGHLNISRLRDVQGNNKSKPRRCENCHRPVRVDLDDVIRSRGQAEKEAVINGERADACACALDTDEPIFFCPEDPENVENSGREGRKTCLQIARELYHFRACGRNWKWLHDAMRPNWNKHRTGTERGPTHLTHNNEAHGTLLSLLLREVFDITLLRRERSGNPNLLAHEIDELLPLPGEEQWAQDRFPFTLAANIKVPFDILLRLGVDIFRDLTFDTWVIQTVLRKLLLSVVPWDEHRRGDGDRIDDTRNKLIETSQTQIEMLSKNQDILSSHDPSFRALYLFPGFAMFNHTCRPHNNADWGFDRAIPNRIVVWASRPIARGEEIRIAYRDGQMSGDTALRLLGRDCDCTLCAERAPRRASVDYDEPDYFTASLESSQRDSDASGDGEMTSEEPEQGASKRASSVRIAKGAKGQTGTKQTKGKAPETRPTGKATKRKRARVVEDEDESEDDSEPPARRANAARRARVSDDEDEDGSESEDDDDDEARASRPPTTRVRFKVVDRPPPPCWRPVGPEEAVDITWKRKRTARTEQEQQREQQPEQGREEENQASETEGEARRKKRKKKRKKKKKKKGMSKNVKIKTVDC